MPRILAVLLTFLLCPGVLFPSDISFHLLSGKGKQNLKKGIYLLTDETGEMSFDDVRMSQDFHLMPEGVPNLGVSENVHWIRFDVSDEGDDKELLLEISQPSIQHLRVYRLEGEQYSVEDLGSSYPYKNRVYDHQHFLVDMNLKKGHSIRYFLRIQSANPVVVPLAIGTKEAMFRSFMRRDLYFGFYVGAMLVMFFYNLFVYFSVRDRSYLIYVFYIIVVGLTQASLSGYTLRYLTPDNPWIANQSLVILPAVGGMLAIEFLKVFTRSRLLIPKWTWFFIVGHVLFTICIAVSIVGLNVLATRMIQPSALMVSLFMIAAVIVMIRKGSRPAKFFLTAWAIFLLGIIIYVLKEGGVLPYNAFTNHILELGSAAEAILLSIGLADRINVLRKEKEESQEEALRALEENERIIREQNVVLESKVEERTAALKKANSDLNTALVNLKEAQSQLVSAEKMASLGQLTAGIAHEINNPINFVKSNIEPLKQNIEEILELVNRYDAVVTEKREEMREITAQIDEYKKSIDYSYMIEETGDILEGIREGADRTAEIVSGLRTFSHVDDIGLKRVDVNKGIVSTLQLLKGEVSKEIDVELELGETKQLECYGGKINQVFMNVINNSIQAVKAKNGAGGKITIRTEDLTEGVKISIIDEGIGMDKETRDRMFEPFFTTKDVGEGTGLGLSVVYGIVESHHGTVQVDSEKGKGTSFIINLPYMQPN